MNPKNNTSTIRERVTNIDNLKIAAIPKNQMTMEKADDMAGLSLMMIPNKTPENSPSK